MRRAIWLALGAAVGISWMSFGGPRAPSSEAMPETIKQGLPIEAIAAPTAAQSMVPARPKVTAASVLPPPVEVRRVLYDAPNLFEAVRKARASGSPDEKGWAALLMRECYGYLSKEQHSERVAGLTDSPEVGAQRLAAFDELHKRCDGFNDVSWPARREATAELAAAAHASTSTFHTLTALKARHDRGDTRWNQADSRLVADALYGADPLIKREAFWALYTAIDRNAPGGEERRDALLFALADQMINPPLSTFERLAQCAVAAICSESDLSPSIAVTPNRLQSLYLEAIAQRHSPEVILAIR